MTKSFASPVFTPAVKALQERYGSRRQYARLEQFGETWRMREHIPKTQGRDIAGKA